MSSIPPNPDTPNPFAAPTTSGPMTAQLDGPEGIRNQYLSHEASIRSFGLLYYIGGGLVSIFGLIAVAGAIMVMVSGEPDAAAAGGIMLVVALLYLGFGVFQLFVASGLRKLTQFGRIGGTVLGALGLIGFPIGTLICGYLLYLLWSEKGNIVFSEHYRQVINATPHIKYKTSVIVWILLALLLGVIALAFFAVIFGSMTGV